MDLSQTISKPEDRTKKILLFGKTGQGKSTIANMLVNGNLHDPVFKMGDGMRGVTDTCEAHSGRGYFVFDTVGLGEDPSNYDEGEAVDAIEQIRKFLESTQKEFSHILFVREAARYDQLDREIFDIFTTIFKGAEPAFGVVITKCVNPEKWGRENSAAMQKHFGKNISLKRFIYVDFPPLDEEEVQEGLYVRKRAKSLASLDAFLAESFQSNNYQYFEANYVRLSGVQLVGLAKELFLRVIQDTWEYVKQFIDKPGKYAMEALAFFTAPLAALGVKITGNLFGKLKTATNPEVLRNLLLGLVPGGEVARLLL